MTMKEKWACVNMRYDILNDLKKIMDSADTYVELSHIMQETGELELSLDCLKVSKAYLDMQDPLHDLYDKIRKTVEEA